MGNFFVFGVVGLLTGAAARLLYPRRQTMHIAATMLVGIVGGVIGGLISQSCWPAAEGEFHTGNLILAMVGAMSAITLWAFLAYRRRLHP